MSDSTRSDFSRSSACAVARPHIDVPNRSAAEDDAKEISAIAPFFSCDIRDIPPEEHYRSDTRSAKEIQMCSMEAIRKVHMVLSKNEDERKKTIRNGVWKKWNKDEMKCENERRMWHIPLSDCELK